jgi:hypothetical protein
MFHPGYWGRHVGYYGGVNYGFGYMGIGFVGGEWHGRDFRYNTAVMHVNRERIRNVYEDRTIVNRYTVVNDRHVAYSGGPGGIRHDPRPEERVAMREQHMAPSSFQQQHIQAARSDRSLYVKNNGGRPQTLAVERPLTGGGHGTAPNVRQNQPGGFNGNNRPETRPAPGVQNRQTMQQPGNASRTPSEQPRNMNQRPAQENRSAPQYRPTPETRPAPQYRPAPEARPAPQRPTPQARPAPPPRQEQNHRPEQKEPRGH